MKGAGRRGATERDRDREREREIFLSSPMFHSLSTFHMHMHTIHVHDVCAC